MGSMPQPLLCNRSVNMFQQQTLCFLRGWCGSYITTVTKAGSNTSTVTLRIVRGNEMGSLKSETVKYGREYQGTRTQERLRWQGPAAYIKDRLGLSSERAPHKKQDRNCQESNKYLVMGPRLGSTPRFTDCLTVNCNVTLTLT
jgi:hypothetical protein